MQVDFKVSEHILIDPAENTIKILRPESNMQTDAACFEAVALLLKCKHPNLKVQLQFDMCNWNGKFENLVRDQQHYMRFLFRVHRFTELYKDWVTISEDEKEEVGRFADCLRNSDVTNNAPMQAAKFNPKKGKEHILENMFIKDGGRYLSELMRPKSSQLVYLDHQLPNGLFAERTVQKKTKIFPTGYFDLWGVNQDNELCLFELKTTDNQKMGIISELFFYAEYVARFLMDPKSINPDTTTFRGYDRLLKAVHNDSRHIRAYFLVGENQFHSEIKKYQSELLSLLNANEKITYQFLQYEPAKDIFQYKTE